MGSLIEETRLAQYMPARFKSKCPCCQQAWAFDTIDDEKDQRFNGRIAISCKNECFTFCRTQHFVPRQLDTAWQKLWRSFVQSFGLSEAIRKTDEALFKAVQTYREAIGRSISADEFAHLLNRIADATEISRGNGMAPCVYVDTGTDEMRLGVRFERENESIGSRSHLDRGVGIHKNNDAVLLWLKPASAVLSVA